LSVCMPLPPPFPSFWRTCRGQAGTHVASYLGLDVVLAADRMAHGLPGWGKDSRAGGNHSLGWVLPKAAPHPCSRPVGPWEGLVTLLVVENLRFRGLHIPSSLAAIRVGAGRMVGARTDWGLDKHQDRGFQNWQFALRRLAFVNCDTAPRTVPQKALPSQLAAGSLHSITAQERP